MRESGKRCRVVERMKLIQRPERFKRRMRIGLAEQCLERFDGSAFVALRDKAHGTLAVPAVGMETPTAAARRLDDVCVRLTASAWQGRSGIRLF